jgi:hypothetical protein
MQPQSEDEVKRMAWYVSMTPTPYWCDLVLIIMHAASW